nr:sulfite exporter TauE/SafE family protein [Methylogaea oryzae]
MLLLLFAGMMLATGGAMLFRRQKADEESANTCPGNVWVLLAIALQGVVVGALTGLVGAGGGFVVVPALCLLGGLSMRAAIGTSLLIIAANSFAGLAGYLSHVQIDLQLAGAVTAATISGSLAGSWLAPRVSAPALRRGFALFVIAVAVYLLQRELNAGEFIQRLASPCQLWTGGIVLAAAVVLPQLGNLWRANR